VPLKLSVVRGTDGDVVEPELPLLQPTHAARRATAAAQRNSLFMRAS
jgi:hypothetical protein